MSGYPPFAVEIVHTPPSTARRFGARWLVAPLIIAAVLAGMTWLLFGASDGAAPAPALSVVGETFDKGF